MALYVGVACVLYVATLAVFSQRRSVGIK
jgi:hypothetical protein